jgi:hypothetical protein
MPGAIATIVMAESGTLLHAPLRSVTGTLRRIRAEHRQHDKFQLD